MYDPLLAASEDLHCSIFTFIVAFFFNKSSVLGCSVSHEVLEQLSKDRVTWRTVLNKSVALSYEKTVTNLEVVSQKKTDQAEQTLLAVIVFRHANPTLVEAAMRGVLQQDDARHKKNHTHITEDKHM